MLKETALYYFSPTGNTKKVGETFCKALAEEVKIVNLGLKNKETDQANSEVMVIAAPVFAGRIPTMVTEKIKELDGAGKKVITLVVYGVRAYDDALLELNQTVAECGFHIVASGAFVAEHSIVREVGAGRPDEADLREIEEFAKLVFNKMASGNLEQPKVPGNYPYREGMKVAATPISLAECNQCGQCREICPTGAIQITTKGVNTELEKCIFCMACIAHCPKKVRILPPPMQEAMNEKLGIFKDVPRENEYFI